MSSTLSCNPYLWHHSHEVMWVTILNLYLQSCWLDLPEFTLLDYCLQSIIKIYYLLSRVLIVLDYFIFVYNNNAYYLHLQNTK